MLKVKHFSKFSVLELLQFLNDAKRIKGTNFHIEIFGDGSGALISDESASHIICWETNDDCKPVIVEYIMRFYN